VSPDEASLAFAAALSAGDADAAIACWDEDAVIIAPDGAETRGRAAVRDRVGQLIGAGARLEISAEVVGLAGDTALAVTTAELSGAPLRGTVVYRRGEDGRWRILIDRLSQ
jgi:ketosteroid isomerase-like protein